MKQRIWTSACICFIAVACLVAPELYAGQKTYTEHFFTTQYRDILSTTAFWNPGAGSISLHPFVMTPAGSYNTPGRTQGICVSGNFAFVADGEGGLRVINIANPAAPTLVGGYDTSGNSQSIAVSGNYVFVADGSDGLLIFNISNPGTPSLVGSYDTPDRACRVDVEGDYAYVADRFSGLLIIDVRNPATPVLMGSYDTPGDARSICVRGDYAYVADGANGLLIVNVSNPASPVARGNCSTPSAANGVHVLGDKAYVTGTGMGLLAVDIGDPASPSIIGSCGAPANTHGIYVAGNYAYVAAEAAGIKVFDISDPEQPWIINSYDTPDSSVDVVVSGNLAFIADLQGGMEIVNAAGIVTPPAYIGGYDTQGFARRICVDGSFAYIADQAGGLRIVDVGDPANPALKGSFDAEGSDYPMSLDVEGDLVYITEFYGGLQVIDVSDPENPTLVGSHATPNVANDVEVEGDYAYVAVSSAGVQVFDVSDPTNPVLFGSVATAGSALGIEIEGDYAYVAVSNFGMQILTISDPAHPTAVGIFSGGYCSDVAVDGHFAYLASINYFRVLNISNPSSPVQIGSYPIDYNSFGVEIHGDYAFLAADQQGLMMFNVADPAHPSLTGRLDTPNRVYDVAVAGDRAYVIDDISGLYVCGVFERSVDRTRTAKNIVQSSVIDASEEEIVSVNLHAMQVGSIQWEVSADGGMNWESITPNIGWLELSHSGSDLLWRALFVYDRTGLNPHCTSLQIEWCTSVGRVIVYFDEALSDPDTCISSSEDKVVFGYVTAEGISAPITGIEFKIKHPPGYRLIAETCPFPLKIGTATNGVAIAFGEVKNASDPLHVYTLVYYDQFGACGECSVPGGSVMVVPHPNSQSGLLEATDRYLNFVYASGGTSDLCYSERRDADNDGVPNPGDLCPAVSSAYFDRDGDGCCDEGLSARHVEYWSAADTMVYYISEGGAPGIADGSDIDALIASMNAWRGLPGAAIPVIYAGTTPAIYADAFDNINMITFMDPIMDDDSNRYFSGAVVAVGITTSFTEPTLYNDRWYRPGEIFDADMLFNPARTFTVSGGTGIDLQSVATHEAGHLFGISHSALRTSTMFPILGHGTETASLTIEDSLQFIKAYPETSILATANRIEGRIEDYLGNPVLGAAVFAIDAAHGDTTACEFTLPDGSYNFLGLPDGSYYIAIHPLNGESSIGFVEPAAINWLVYSWGATDFIPEYWNDNESELDSPLNKTLITIGGGASAIANIVTNADLDPPAVVETTPASEALDVRVDATIIIEYSEAIDHTTLSDNFRLVNKSTNQAVGGNAAMLENSTVMAFTAWDLLAYETTYACSLGTGLSDKYGNHLAYPVAFEFTTESAPPLSLKNIVPDKGIAGSVVIISGTGFDPTPPHNAILFRTAAGTGTVAATIVSASPYQLVATVPAGAGSGDVVVTVGAVTSAPRPFTILPASKALRGYEIGVCHLGSSPRSHVILPDEREAFVATRDGLSVVGILPGLPDFCVESTIPFDGGLDDLASTPDGRWVYGICRSDSLLIAIDPDTRTVPFVLPIDAEAISITIDPTGRRAYVPTTAGVIQKWDIEEGSPTQREQIGVIISHDGNLRSNVAIDPAGELMLTISGTGKMLAFQAATGLLLGSVFVGADPQDIAIDPTGLRAYVTDANGTVTIVSLRSSNTGPLDLFKVCDIGTGGSLRKAAVSPTGTYLLAANRQLNLIDAIDLDPSNTTYRTVAATIPHGINPIGVAVSSKGDYAYSIVEKDQQLVVLGIGVGPVLRSISKSGGPDGTKLAFGGAELGWDADTVQVLFGNRSQDPIVVRPDWTIGSALGVTAPVGVPSGPVSVRTGTGAYAYSNELYFNILEPTPLPGQLRLVSSIQIGSLSQVASAAAISPLGNQMIAGTASGNLIFVDADPSSPTFNQVIHTLNTGISDVYDIAVTPDGRRAYVSFRNGASIAIVDCNRSSSTYGTLIGTVQDWTPNPMTNPLELSVSPDGATCLVHDNRLSGWDRAYRIDINPDSPTYNTALDTVVAEVSLDVNEFVYCPSGLCAYAPSTANSAIYIIDMYPPSATFGRVMNTITIPGVMGDDYPESCSFIPDESRCLVLVKSFDYALGEIRAIRSLNTGDPIHPILEPSGALVEILPGPPSPFDRIQVSPRGDRALVHCDNLGLYNIDLTSTPFHVVNSFESPIYEPRMDLDFSPDGSYVYAAGAYDNTVRMLDFSGADYLVYEAGNEQIGVVDQYLSAPLRVRATSAGWPAEGVSVRYSIESGGGRFAGSNSPVQIVTTDVQGYAQVQWILGSAIGTQTASASGDGLSGSPIYYSATGVENPAVLPLQFAGAVPANDAQNIGITTTVIARFSRRLDKSSLTESNFFLRRINETHAIPAKIGLADQGKTASLTPREPLDVNAAYTLEVRGGISDASGGPLINPGVSSFSTITPPPLELCSVNPPSSVPQVMIVLAGTGFGATTSDISVLFNDNAATPVEAECDYLKVYVPASAKSGTIQVQVGTQISNPLPFTVLEPSTAASDKVIASIDSHDAIKSLAIHPAGVWAYAISPEGNVVVPINIPQRRSLSPIPVGNHPISITMHPAGRYAYIANFQSSSVSIIDVDPASSDFLVPDTTLTVGNYPIDLAMSPDGDRVYVVNASSDEMNNVDVLDTDEESANYHSVLATIGTGAVTKSVVMAPDGSRLYFGTDTGYIVLDALDYGVLATIQLGVATRSVVMHPDGGLLFLLTTEGKVLIIDVVPGSTKENAVLATIGRGAGTTSITLSPDGSMLYLIQEELDNIIAFKIRITGSASVIDPDALIPPVQVSCTAVDTVYAGEDPEDIAFDPTGSGLALVPNSGPKTVTFLSTEVAPADTLTACLEISPRTLNLKSRGRWIHGRIELDPAFPPGEIDLSTVLLRDTIPAELDQWTIEDADSDGVQELVATFDRVAFQIVMPQGEYVPVWITGKVRDHSFIGEDTIRTIRPTVHYPSGGVVPLNKPVNVSWTSPVGFDVDMVGVHWSPDDGASWLPIATRMPDAGSIVWLTPSTPQDSCRVMVTLYRNGEDIGMGMNQEMFVVADPVAVMIASFEGSMDAAAAMLRWRTSGEAPIKGFHLLRSEKKDAIFERVTRELIPLSGTVAGGAYEYRDSTVRANHTYYYMLEQVSERGSEKRTGPYMVTFRLEFSLGQNVPNPFNPTTTISFAIPERMAVRLAIYDVRGKVLATLVDDVLEEGFKSVVWDGRDTNGSQVASGVYFYRLQAGKKVLTKKMVLLK